MSTRLLQAFLREQLLHLEKRDGTFVVPLTQGYITLENVSISLLARYDITGNIQHLSDQDSTPKRITNTNELLALLKPSINPDSTQWEHFIKEIDNHVANSIISQQHMSKRNQTIAREAKSMGCSTLLTWLDQQKKVNTLFFEQWVSQGHPCHPCSKTKLGLSEKETLLYSPEFETEIPICLAALHQDNVHIESMEADSSYVDWFFQQFPEHASSWPKDYIPIPIHSWQAQHTIPSLFKSLIDSKQLMMFPNLTIPAQPTLSFRTVAPTQHQQQSHIKLPINVQTTSALRTVSPASTENGPKVSEKDSYSGSVENTFDVYVTTLLMKNHGPIVRSEEKHLN